MKASHSQPKELLVSVAESIGATLGTIAAKAEAAQRAIGGGKQKVSRDVKRKNRTLVRKGNRAAAKLRKSKPVRVARRTVRKAAKRVARRRSRARK